MQLSTTRIEVYIYTNLANDFFKKGEYDNAIFLYEKLLEIDKENNNFMSTIYANKALCYLRMNRLIEALNDINKSLKYNSNYTKVVNN